MSGRIGRQSQPGPIDRLAIRHFERAPRPQPQLIEGRGLGRAERELMPRHVVAMGVRNEGPGLATAKVDRQVGGSQLQAVFPVKQEPHA